MSIHQSEISTPYGKTEETEVFPLYGKIREDDESGGEIFLLPKENTVSTKQTM